MLIKKFIAYLGIDNPTTKEEIKIEISGLRHAISVANERIANLEQAVAIADLQNKELLDAQNQLKGQEKSGVLPSD